MPAPLLVPLILLGGATIALAASSAKKKKKQSGLPPGRTYTLDANLPPRLRDQILAALATEQDPNKLEGFAQAIAPSFPMSAAALRAKEADLGGIPPQLAPQPNPAPQSAPQAAPTPAPRAVPATPDWQSQLLLVPDPPRTQVIQAMMAQNDPTALEAAARQLDATYPVAAWVLRTKEATLLGHAQPALPSVAPTAAPPAGAPAALPVAVATPAPDWQSQLLLVPDPPRTQVIQQMMSQTDPNALEAAAKQLDATYPVAAWVLRTKEATLLGKAQPAFPSPSPAPAPQVVMPQVALPAVLAATPYLGGLDPGMPIEVQKAVVGALTTESDPAKLQGFATAIQAQYPIAAGLLVGKAQALRLAQTMPSAAPVPSAAPSPAPAPVPTPAPLPTAIVPSMLPSSVSSGVFPTGDASTRSGRSAARPTGYPFILIRPTDSTYPAKIAGQATGNSAAFTQMTPLNPHVAPGGHWGNLVNGDTLNIPWAWASKLARTYLIETDPGVSQAPVAAATPSSLLPVGGSNVAHA